MPQAIIPSVTARKEDWLDELVGPVESAVNWTSLYRWFDAGEVLLYVGVTTRGGGRDSEHVRTAEWWKYVARRTTQWFPRPVSAYDAERTAISSERPVFNVSGVTDQERVRRRAAYLVPAPPDPIRQAELIESTYKLTVVLDGDEHDALEAVTDAVLAELRPRRVGKGWRTKVIRALIFAADRDPELRARITEVLRPVSEVRR